MKDHEIAKIVNQLRDIGKEYGQTQQPRARIHAAIVPVLKDYAKLEAELDGLKYTDHLLTQNNRKLRAETLALQAAYADLEAENERLRADVTRLRGKLDKSYKSENDLHQSKTAR